jgi:uncharacterized protein (TIGR02145 family)
MKISPIHKVFLLLLYAGFNADMRAQFEQLIFKPSGVVSDAVSDIDSLLFNSSGDTLFVVSQSGETASHLLSEIDSVAFTPLINSNDHSCGADSVHNAAFIYGSVSDLDGTSYKTIIIGNHEWMAENLKSRRFANGDTIPYIPANISWQSLTTGAYSWWNNDSTTYDCPYGKLYNWYAVADLRNVCPAGWHVPSDDELTNLEDLLGGFSAAGGKMKSQGIQFWNTPNLSADNSSGFSALPGGHRLDIGAFGSVGDGCYLWTSTPYDTQSATYHFIAFNLVGIIVSNSNKTVGYSVRCKRD